MGSDLPRVDRSLKQLVEAGQQLFSKTKKGHAGILWKLISNPSFDGKGWEDGDLPLKTRIINHCKNVIRVTSVSCSNIMHTRIASNSIDVFSVRGSY